MNYFLDHTGSNCYC